MDLGEVVQPAGGSPRRSAEPSLTSLTHRQGGCAGVQQAWLALPAADLQPWWSSQPLPAFCGALTTEPLPHFTEDGARWAVVPGLLLHRPAAPTKQTSELTRGWGPLVSGGNINPFLPHLVLA